MINGIPDPPPHAATPFRRVLCGVNGARGAFEAVQQALSLVDPAGSLTFLAVSDARGIGPTAQASLGEHHARDALADAQRISAARGIAAETQIVRASDPRAALAERAGDFDLLVVGAHGRSRAAGILLGSVAAHAVHASPVPVLVARLRMDLAFPGRVLVATRDAADRDTCRLAAQIASAHAVPLILAHVDGRSDHATRHALAEQGADAIELMNREPVVLSSGGEPSQRIPEMAASADAGLVVVGNSGRRGVAALASVSERIAHRAPCSVLVVRGRRQPATRRPPNGGQAAIAG